MVQHAASSLFISPRLSLSPVISQVLCAGKFLTVRSVMENDVEGKEECGRLDGPAATERKEGDTVRWKEGGEAMEGDAPHSS